MNSLDRLAFSRRFPRSIGGFVGDLSVVKPYRGNISFAGLTPTIVVPPIILAETGEIAINRSWPTVFSGLSYDVTPFSGAIAGFAPSVALPVAVHAQVGNIEAIGRTPEIDATSIPTNGLATAWWLDDGSGTVVSDSSGNGIDGTITDIGYDWLPAGLYIYDGNVMTNSPHPGGNMTAVVAFKLDTVSTISTRWVWGWSPGGVLITLDPGDQSGVNMRVRGRAAVGGSNIMRTITSRYIVQGEWVVVAVSAADNGNFGTYLWADGTRYSVEGAIAGAVDDSTTDFRMKGSATPEFTFGAALYWQRAMNVAELEQVVASVKSVVSNRGVAFA